MYLSCFSYIPSYPAAFPIFNFFKVAFVSSIVFILTSSTSNNSSKYFFNHFIYSTSFNIIFSFVSFICCTCMFVVPLAFYFYIKSFLICSMILVYFNSKIFPYFLPCIVLLVIFLSSFDLCIHYIFL